jgi:hypothetical protein
MVNLSRSKLLATFLRGVVASSALLFACALVGCVGIGGERIPVIHDPIDLPGSRVSGTLAVPEQAEDVRADSTRIGRATITLFAITSGQIRTQEPLTIEVMRNIREALVEVGYSVSVIDPSAVATRQEVRRTLEVAGQAEAAAAVEEGPTDPVLNVEIRSFYFRNYNWVWPIVPTWGDIVLGVKLTDVSGNLTFKRTLKGGGTSFCLLGHCAFKAATRRAMNEVLEDLVQAITSQEFQTAVVQPPAAKPTIAKPTEAEPSAEETDPEE